MNCKKASPILFSLFAVLLMAPTTRAAGLQVQGNVGKLIPIAIKGYTADNGEVAKVLAFDLEVMGCKVVPEGDASYVLEGKIGADNLTGILRDNAGNFGFNLNINGAVPRVLAHALSNAAIKAITGQNGIAHTRILFTMKTGKDAWEVFQSDYDGHNPVALTNDETIVQNPLWMPNRDGLFYTSWMTIGGLQNTTVVRHDLKTGNRKVYARFKGLNTGGAMAPNGSVALILSKGRATDVYLAPPTWEFLKDIKGEKLYRHTRSREEKFRAGDNLPAGGMVFAHPEFIETQSIEMCGQIQVALELEGRVFTDWVMGSDEAAEFDACHGSYPADNLKQIKSHLQVSALRVL